MRPTERLCRYLIVAALISALGNGVVAPCFAIIYSNVLQSFFKPSDVMESEAPSYTGQFMAIACCVLVATLGRIGLWYTLGEELTAKLRGLAFENLLKCEMSYFDFPDHSTGSLDTRLSADASLVKGATGEGLSQVFQCTSAIVAAVVIAMLASWRLGLIIVAAFPFVIAATTFMNQTFTGFERNAKAALEASGHVAVEACTAIRTVTSLNLQPLMVEKFSEGMQERLNSGIKKALTIAGGQAFAQFMTFALFALAFYAGGRFMAERLLTFQELLQVFFAIQMAAQTVASAQSFGPDRAKSKVALKSVFDIIDRPSLINPCDLSTGLQPSTFKGKIEFRNVCFAYPSRPDRWVLNNFSMTILPGQSCALVGESGCGKSSVILLILRFYEPQSGEILLDDVPVEQLNVRWLRENCALVQQEPALFADSIQYVTIVYSSTASLSSW
jgi:ATP-binding cassette, subfamily B (MDR/TAP), member 1